jgi:hypothetical protein
MLLVVQSYLLCLGIHFRGERPASARASLAQIKTLRGIVPICASCKNIRDDRGFWNRVEAYVSAHSEAQFSHGLCPECAPKFFPGIMIPPPKTGG